MLGQNIKNAYGFINKHFSCWQNNLSVLLKCHNSKGLRELLLLSPSVTNYSNCPVRAAILSAQIVPLETDGVSHFITITWPPPCCRHNSHKKTLSLQNNLSLFVEKIGDVVFLTGSVAALPFFILWLIWIFFLKLCSVGQKNPTKPVSNEVNNWKIKKTAYCSPYGIIHIH